jgi:hypothetical protein
MKSYDKIVNNEQIKEYSSNISDQLILITN